MLITDKKIINKIEKALTKIRPYLNEDGGDISLVEVTRGYGTKQTSVVCSSCNVSMMTLKNGVEVN